MLATQGLGILKMIPSTNLVYKTRPSSLNLCTLASLNILMDDMRLKVQAGLVRCTFNK